ncbi:MAG: co-chaperone GroES [Patescibacteria group bacterium]|nr:co-chaperone GroES [Patescibacteria group bacterium]
METLERLGIDSLPAEDREALIDDIINSFGHPAFRPMFPWVLVRVLERMRKVGSIWTPEKQNKVALEGMVLAVWESKLRPNGTVQTSDLAPGDHVVFPHFSGLPIPGMDDKKYRVVKECNWSKDQEGGIYATINYEREHPTSVLIQEVLTWAADTMARNMREGRTDSESFQRSRQQLVDRLHARFSVIDNHTNSLILSGR